MNNTDQTIALAEYFLSSYNINRSRVYAEGYSGGGETLSRVMEKRPELFAAYLQCSSQWDGGYEPVTESRTPVYIVVGESDEYYGAEPSAEAHQTLCGLYRKSRIFLIRQRMQMIRLIRPQISRRRMQTRQSAPETVNMVFQ